MTREELEEQVLQLTDRLRREIEKSTALETELAALRPSNALSVEESTPGERDQAAVTTVLAAGLTAAEIDVAREAVLGLAEALDQVDLRQPQGEPTKTLLAVGVTAAELEARDERSERPTEPPAEELPPE